MLLRASFVGPFRFFMNRFHEAAYSLDLAIKYAEGESKFTNTANVWKHKINQKLENKPFDVNFITISEIPGIQPSKSLSIPKAGPTIAATPAPATPATPASEDIKNTVPAVEKTAAVSSSESSSAPQPAPAPVTDKIKFDWYQNSNGVNISLLSRMPPRTKSLLTLLSPRFQFLSHCLVAPTFPTSLVLLPA